MAKKWFFDPLKPHGYDVIMIDPPSKFKTHTPFPSAKGAQYPVMDDSWMRQLPVNQLASDGCLFCVWSTFPKLEETFHWLDCWGITYITGGAWGKKTIHGNQATGTGYVILSQAEVYLLGRVGSPKYRLIELPTGRFRRNAQPGLVETFEIVTDDDLAKFMQLLAYEYFEAERRQHSRKPDDVRFFLENLVQPDARKVELFAREKPEGWDAWGNEVDLFEGGA